MAEKQQKQQQQHVRAAWTPSGALPVAKERIGRQESVSSTSYQVSARHRSAELVDNLQVAHRSVSAPSETRNATGELADSQSLLYNYPPNGAESHLIGSGSGPYENNNVGPKQQLKLPPWATSAFVEAWLGDAEAMMTAIKQRQNDGKFDEASTMIDLAADKILDLTALADAQQPNRDQIWGPMLERYVPSWKKTNQGK